MPRINRYNLPLKLQSLVLLLVSIVTLLAPQIAASDFPNNEETQHTFNAFNDSGSDPEINLDQLKQDLLKVSPEQMQYVGNITADKLYPIDASSLDMYYQAALKSLQYGSSISDSTHSTAASSISEDSQVTIYIPMDYGDMENELQYNESWSQLPKYVTAAYEIIQYTSQLNHADSHYTLAQFHMFGNYSIPSNLTLSLHHYNQFIELTPVANATAYFHLGLLYSTGGNGVFPVDQSKASLYYQMAFQSAKPTTSNELNIDIQIAMVLAYRHLQGIATNVDFSKSLYYYQYAANKLHLYHDFASGNVPIGGIDLDSYSLRIADFQGGVYGKGAGETSSSLHRSASRYDGLLMSSQNSLQIINDESNGETDDTLFNELYVNVLIYYEGSYLKDRDFKKAYRYAKHAMDSGLPQLKYLGDLDRRFISKCIYVLGRMYLRGEDVVEDHKEARRLFELSLEIFPFGDTFNDLGLLFEYTNDPILHNVTLATELYMNASRHQAHNGDYNYGRRLLESTSPRLKHQGVGLISNATAHLSLEAVYLHSKLLTTNPELAKGQDVTQLQLRDLIYYVESFDPVISPYLKFGFFELLKGNYQTAVTAYSIAAEQGYETAQSSLGYLLYQLPTIGDPEPPKVPESRQLAAITALSRSSAHHNLDSLIYLGDIYTLRQEHSKAFNCYQEASSLGSTQGFFNLGWIYENGVGEKIVRDFHLAKRYYDSALTQGRAFRKRHTHGASGNGGAGSSGMGAYLPVQLALLRLRAKRFWGNLMGIPNYGLSGADDLEDDTKETKLRSWGDWAKLYRRIRNGEEENNNQVVQGNEEGSLLNDFLEQLDLSQEDLVLIMFLVLAFIMFLVVNWNQQRMFRQRGGAQNQNGNIDANRPRFEFNFQVVAI
ncbi:hypothetical protein WICPIJ_003519 [Wickerhamomyces pijperi]|uniref:ERAD-associated E3 ubiquitin-protein ligase component HRD3 n=1 Tax=Wickerhamomyces pijperi TaxID=599730 RepID=A0A9P8Q6Z4_WICPI|nr:hypothetical protein WICPIJ_003519 [Wickerhamomyces pijperi]